MGARLSSVIPLFGFAFGWAGTAGAFAGGLSTGATVSLLVLAALTFVGAFVARANDSRR